MDTAAMRKKWGTKDGLFSLRRRDFHAAMDEIDRLNADITQLRKDNAGLRYNFERCTHRVIADPERAIETVRSDWRNNPRSMLRYLDEEIRAGRLLVVEPEGMPADYPGLDTATSAPHPDPPVTFTQTDYARAWQIAEPYLRRAFTAAATDIAAQIERKGQTP